MSEPLPTPASTTEPNLVQEQMDRLKALSAEAEQLLEKIRQADSSVASHNANISSGLQWWDTRRHEVEEIAQKCEQDSAAIVAALGVIQSHKNTVESLTASISKFRDEIDGIHKQCTALTSNMQASHDKAAACVETLKSQEETNKQLAEAAKRNIGLSEELLAGSTAVGLSKSFASRKNEFKTPRIFWNVVVLLSVLAISSISVYGIATVNESKELSPFFIWLLKKALLSGPFVYLLWYASKQADVARRVEEDYAFKVATAMAFEGFKKQVAELTTSDDSAIGKLTGRVLQIITDRPSVVFDRQDKKESEKIQATLDVVRPLTGQPASPAQPPS